jgi:hypothetical protein
MAGQGVAGTQRTPASVGRVGESRGGRFPLLVALVCTVLAVALFLTGTVPALREADDLRRTEQSNRTELLQLLRQSQELRQRQRALEWDPQTLLVELDRLGLTPDEILEDTSAPR